MCGDIYFDCERHGDYDTRGGGRAGALRPPQSVVATFFSGRPNPYHLGLCGDRTSYHNTLVEAGPCDDTVLGNINDELEHNGEKGDILLLSG
mgnify:CR=1 FL=1